jgi:hypothetical protein
MKKSYENTLMLSLTWVDQSQAQDINELLEELDVA